MSGHKKQHTIPICYLKPWCDPDCPDDFTPYVWIFSKDGKTVQKKSPGNIFHENNFYTVQRADGKRDLTLENGLSGLESQFSTLRDDKLKNHLSITLDEHILLCAFIAAMHVRTRPMRNHQQGQWQGALGMMKKMREWAKTATSEQKDLMAGFPRTKEQKRKSLSYEDVRELAKNPVQHLLMPSISIETPQLCALDFAILETDVQPGFITSDNPCVWSDPEAYRRPPFYRTPGLMYESIEISLPVSPQQAILLNRRDFNGYIEVDENAVNELNRITRFNTSEQFIVNCKLKRDIWFIPGKEPLDSWEKIQKEKKRNPN